MKTRLEIVFNYQSFTKASVLWELCDFSNQLSKSEGLDFVRSGSTQNLVPLTNVLKHIDNSKNPERITIDHPEHKPEERIAIRYTDLHEDFGMGRLDIIGFEKLIRDRDNWLPSIIAHDSFVQCRILDYDYSDVQNLKELELYELNGIDHSHLPKIDNGLPFPVNKIIVDTSSNPGSFSLKKGYIEAVGAEMWLGKLFFERLQVSKEDVLSCGFADVETLESQVVHIKAFDKPFDSDKGEQRELQIALKKLLFGV